MDKSEYYIERVLDPLPLFEAMWDKSTLSFFFVSTTYKCFYFYFAFDTISIDVN